MRLKDYVLATLVANLDRLSADEPSMLLAARWGLLPALLSAGDYSDRYDAADQWLHLWSVHRAAGHPAPSHLHESDEEDLVTECGVWGIDRVTVCGHVHEKAWHGCYGGEHGGQQFGWGGPAVDEWDVHNDNTGSIQSPVAEGFADAYDIDMDNGQPTEPTINECHDDPFECGTITVIVPRTDGVPDTVEVSLSVYRHPWDLAHDQDEDGNRLHSHFPRRWGCDLAHADGPYESLRELREAISEAVVAAWKSSKWDQPDECVYDDEDDAYLALIRYCATVSRGLHAEPDEVDLVVPADGPPYVRAVGHGEDMHHHIDLREAQLLMVHGWPALLPILQEEWGTRTLLDSLTALRERADQVLADRASATWVTVESSQAAGNCSIGTQDFARRHGINLETIGAIRADYLMSLAENDPERNHALRAARAAALGLGRTHTTEQLLEQYVL